MNQKEIIASLSEKLAQHNLAGFLVPKSDSHLGEYNPDHDMRLEFLTGFTGSAGFCMFLQDRSGAKAGQLTLFVDGRYTIQAQDEVDTSLVHLAPYTHEDLRVFVRTHLKQGDRIGYDPWIMSAADADFYQGLCRDKGAELVDTANLVDELWQDQPAMPLGKASIQPVQYAGLSLSDKLATVYSSLEEEGCDYLPLVLADSINWVLNVRGDDISFNPLCLSFGLVDARQRKFFWFVDKEKLSSELMQHLKGVEIRAYDEFEAHLSSLAKGQVLFDSARVSAKVRLLLEPNHLLKKAKDPIILLKAIKNQSEIVGTKDAHARDGVALCEFFAKWHHDPSAALTHDEISIGEVLKSLRSSQDLFRGRSFDDISGYGPNGAVVHYRAASDRCLKIAADNLHLLDSGGQYQDGTTDVTRTTCYGKPSDEQRKHYTLVLKGHLALGRALFPEGTCGFQLDALARQFLWQEGLNYGHGTGHGVGSYFPVHEGPQSISPKPVSEPLRAGMIVSNEPGLYIEGAYGIRIENLCLVVPAKKKGFLTLEALTLCPYEKKLIDVDMLTPIELEQIDAYYDQIKEAIGPRLSKEARSFLEAMRLLP